MSPGLAFCLVLLAFAAVVGWGFLWMKIGDKIEEVFNSESLGISVAFIGAMGIPVATLVALLVAEVGG